MEKIHSEIQKNFIDRIKYRWYGILSLYDLTMDLWGSQADHRLPGKISFWTALSVSWGIHKEKILTGYHFLELSNCKWLDGGGWMIMGEDDS